MFLGLTFGFFYQDPDEEKTAEWLMMRQLFLRYLGTGVGLVLVLLVVTVVLHTLLIYGFSGIGVFLKLLLNKFDKLVKLARTFNH